MTREEVLALRPGDLVMWTGSEPCVCVVRSPVKAVDWNGVTMSGWSASFVAFWSPFGRQHGDYDPDRLEKLA